MPSKQELSKFTLAELQMFARAVKPPISQASIYNKGELIQIMVSERHKAKFHDLRGERFAFRRVPTTKQKTVAMLAASKARGKMETRVRVPFKTKVRVPTTKQKTVAMLAASKARGKMETRVRVPFKRKAKENNKGGCKVGRKGESPNGGCKIGKKK